GWSDNRIIKALETSASMVYRVRKQLVSADQLNNLRTFDWKRPCLMESLFLGRSFRDCHIGEVMAVQVGPSKGRFGGYRENVIVQHSPAPKVVIF
ncbi:MAG TPA: hypothetical protein VN968_28750, partial [Bradyrhizobium sp.]|nr:hypothetical protein [Bradyrhizobium sp.]